MEKKYYEQNQYKHLGEFFRDKRRDAGVTQKELAAAVNMSVRQIIRFENGTPMNSTYLLKIMYVLKITGIWGIYKQVSDFSDFDCNIDDMSLEQKIVLKKTWGI